MNDACAPAAAAAIAPHADHDGDLIRLWLHGRPATTRRAYADDVAQPLA